MANKRQRRVGRGEVPPPDAQDSSIVRANEKRKTVMSPSYVSLYANDVEVQTTPWDLRLTLGVISGLTKEEASINVTVTQLGELRISPQLAKRLALIIIQQLTIYEHQFGQIPMPTD